MSLMVAGASALRSGNVSPASPPAFVNSSTMATNEVGSTMTRSWPPGYIAGDYGLIVVQTPNEPVGTPSGWTKIAETGLGASNIADSTRITVFGRTAASNSEATATISKTAGVRASATMLIYRGVNPSIPCEAQSDGDGTTGAIVIPSITTLGGNRLVVYVVGDGRDQGGARYADWTNSNLSAMSERFDTGTATGTGGGIGIADGVLSSAGASGAGSVAFSLATTNYVAVAMALRPI